MNKLLVLVLLLCSVIPAAVAAPSPTGRTPRLLWTAERQDTWNRMRTENHVWWQLTKSNADKTGTTGQRYGDIGLWATLVYQTTGEKLYADKAIALIRKEFANTGKRGDNFLREYGMEYAIMYDWLHPALTPADRDGFITMLNRWGDEVINAPSSATELIRTTDSDLVVGKYFQLVYLTLATRGDNPRAEQFLNHPLLGGLTATARDRKTSRNAIRDYCEMAEGGVWIESSHYNHGTSQLLALGVEGVKTATGVDSFPDVRRYLQQLCNYQLYEMSSDLKGIYQWGDNEQPRDLRMWRRVTLLCILQGLHQNLDEGAYLNQYISDLQVVHGSTGFGSAEPWGRFMLFFNPFTPKKDWRSLTNHFHAPGQGFTIYRSEDSLFTSHFPPKQSYVDHQVHYFGEFQLWRKGEWALTHPLGYSGDTGVTSRGEGTNSLVIRGLSSFGATKKINVVEMKDNYSFISGNTGGAFYVDKWDPPREFVKDWTRSLFFLSSLDKKSDIIIIHDRIDTGELLDFAKYKVYDQPRITSAPAVKQLIFHVPAQPALNDTHLTWTTPKGQLGRVDFLLPSTTTRLVMDQDATWPDNWPNPPKSEQKWALHIQSNQATGLESFLNVVALADAGIAVPTSLVKSDAGELEGALVRSSGTESSLVMFPALRETLSGASFNLTSVGDVSAYLAGFDLSKEWTVLVDNKAVPVSKGSGLLRFTLPGAGAHVVTVGIGLAPVPDPIPVPDPTKFRVEITWKSGTKIYEFGTKAELDAFKLGLQEVSSQLEYTIIER